MKTIWKFRLFFKDTTTIEMPKDAQILCCQEQYDTPMMWAVVSPDAEKEKRTFILRETGHSMPDYPAKYINTFQLKQLNLVFHLFEKEEN